MAYLAVMGKCYLVGGAVRDLLMQSQPNDFDLMTDVPPEIIMRLPGAKRMTNVTNTIAISLAGTEIEVTSLQNKGHGGISEDLFDRDLTINSLALPILLRQGRIVPGTLLDPTGRGVADIEQGIIRFSGKINGARLIRACRFASTLGFMMPPESLLVLKGNNENIKLTPVEIVQDELRKILQAKDPAPGLRIMRETGMLGHLLKGLEAENLDQADFDRVGRADKDVRFVVLLAELGYTAKSAAKFLKKYKYSSDQVTMAQKLLEALKATSQRLAEIKTSDRAIRSVLSSLFSKSKGQYLTEYINLIDLYFSASDTLISRIRQAALAPLTVKELAIDIQDDLITARGISGGAIRAVNDHLLALVIADPAKNNRQALLRELDLFIGQGGK